MCSFRRVGKDWSSYGVAGCRINSFWADLRKSENSWNSWKVRGGVRKAWWSDMLRPALFFWSWEFTYLRFCKFQCDSECVRMFCFRMFCSRDIEHCKSTLWWAVGVCQTNNGMQSVLVFVQCAYCSKAFFNASFLQAHLARRHGESSRSQIPSQPEPMPTASQNPELMRQLEELRVKLSMTESQLAEERNRRNEKQQTVCGIFIYVHIHSSVKYSLWLSILIEIFEFDRSTVLSLFPVNINIPRIYRLCWVHFFSD